MRYEDVNSAAYRIPQGTTTTVAPPSLPRRSSLASLKSASRNLMRLGTRIRRVRSMPFDAPQTGVRGKTISNPIPESAMDMRGAPAYMSPMNGAKEGQIIFLAHPGHEAATIASGKTSPEKFLESRKEPTNALDTFESLAPPVHGRVPVSSLPPACAPPPADIFEPRSANEDEQESPPDQPTKSHPEAIAAVVSRRQDDYAAMQPRPLSTVLEESC